MPDERTHSSFPAGDGLAEWQLRVAEGAVRRFLATRPGLAGEREDLVQDVLEHWLRRRGLYDATRGASPQTFMRHLVERHLLDIEGRGTAAKRGGGQRQASLDAPLDEESGETLGDLRADPSSDPDGWLLKSAIRAANGRLRERERRIVEALARGYTKAEVARLLRISRRHLYEDLARIKDIYRDAGLGSD